MGTLVVDSLYYAVIFIPGI